MNRKKSPLAESDDILDNESDYLKNIDDKTEHKKLTKWKNEPLLSELKLDLENAQSAHSAQVTKVEGWVDHYHIKGSAARTKVKGQSNVAPKVIRRFSEWRFANLSEPFISSDKTFDINPVSWEDREAAKQNGLILNNQFNTKINKVSFIDSLVRAGVVEGTAVVRVGWNFEEEEYEDEEITFEYQNIEDPEQQQQFQQQVEQYIAQKENEPDSYSQNNPAVLEMVRVFESTQQLVMPQPVGKKKVTKKRAKINAPSLQICNIEDVIADPTCEGEIDKAKFVIFKSQTNLADLKSKSFYTNLADLEKKTENTDSISGDSSEELKHGFKFEDKTRQELTKHEYWGYYDIHGDGTLVPIVATWVNSCLIRMQENPFPDKKIPVVFIPYLPVKNSLYGEPDGELLRDQQQIIGALTRGTLDTLGKSANSQTATPKGFLDATNRRRFEEKKDYQYNPVSGLHPSQAVYVHQYPQISQSALQMMEMANNEAETLTGVKAFGQGGISGSSLGDSATGVRGALDAASKRETGILRRMSQGIIDLGRKMISMNAVFLSEEEVVRITNSKFVTIRKEDLAGNFDLKLTISTAENDNNKSQELAFMLQTLGPSVPQEMIFLIMGEVADLKKMPDLAKKLREYKPEPDPNAQKLQELEMQKLEAEIGLIQAQAKEAGTKGDVNTAKVPVEQARAGNLESSANKSSLDFMEQQSGLKHTRDMDKLSQKAKDNLVNSAQNADRAQATKLTQQMLQNDAADDKQAQLFNHQNQMEQLKQANSTPGGNV